VLVGGGKARAAFMGYEAASGGDAIGKLFVRNTFSFTFLFPCRLSHRAFLASLVPQLFIVLQVYQKCTGERRREFE